MTDNLTYPLLDCQQVAKSFVDGHHQLEIFRDLDLRIESGESVAIIGRSGSGKTTLLHIIAGLEKFDSGRILFTGRDIDGFDAGQRDRYHLDSIALIFQFHFLLPDFSACENAAMPALTAGVPRRQALQSGLKILEKVGLSERAHHLPASLSGGERQRVAIARALINQPQLIIADEPTGNLDGTTAEIMFSLLLEQTKSSGTSLLIATHDVNIAKRVDSCYELSHAGLKRLPA